MTRLWSVSLLVASSGGVGFAAETASQPPVAGELPPPSADLVAPRPRSPEQPSLHPALLLRDERGVPVAVSGEPVSAARTCDGCHDVRWIAAHDRHAGVWARERGGAAGSSPNCFLCHVRSADRQAQAEAIAQGRPSQAETATLAATALVTRGPGGWQWRKEGFAPDGTVTAATLGLGRPGDRACGFCHGIVHDGSVPLALSQGPGQRMTELAGVVFSGQRISDSAVNLADKDSLTRPWDVHAERMVSCASCHFSPNHPAYAFSDRGLEHLQFDARRGAITDYLRRPDHRLASGARGEAPGGNPGEIRRCEGCHDAGKAHRFLPRAERHFAALRCEACHVPMAHAPARQETDWTMLTAERKPRVVARGVRDDGFVLGFRPALLLQPDGHGGRKLGPSNVATTYRWVEQTDQGPRPLAAEVLERAFFDGEHHRAELLRALDRNGDGQLDDRELVLDTEAKVKMARDLLVAAGARAPAIAAEVAAHAIHHGISPGRFATRACSSCHAADSRIGEPFLLAEALPFGVVPVFTGDAAAGQLVRDRQGGLRFAPSTAGLHVFGHTRSGFLDGLGLVWFAGAVAGASMHGLLRVRSARRRKREQA